MLRINTAHGGIVDEVAVVESLRAEHLAGERLSPGPILASSTTFIPFTCTASYRRTLAVRS